MKKRVARLLKKTLLTLLMLTGLISLLTVLFMQQKTFGKHPSGARLERIVRSPNYRDGSFQNVYPTEVMRKGASMLKVFKEFLIKAPATTPPKPLPSVKTDLRQLNDQQQPVIVWFGHSSYFIKYQGLQILVDPVFSGSASPVSLFGKSFPGSDVYAAADFDTIDMLILTHDHYDHLDYKTIVELLPKVKGFYTGLGVGAHLEHWGVPAGKITELDWWEYHLVSEQAELIATPARHFSGRSFTRGKTLWSSFVLQLNGYRLFLGGDSGYDASFKAIGEKYGPFDLVMLDAGQYGDDWPYIHMVPEQTVQATLDLKARRLLPVHWAKFELANHEWNDPVKRVIRAATQQNVPITTPRIGEPVVVNHYYPTTHWWNF
jgi:L-ascorbate metabolism protein UlaG (beta-lactamase superfamily)